jgi:hypothetical protein
MAMKSEVCDFSGVAVPGLGPIWQQAVAKLQDSSESGRWGMTKLSGLE